MADRKDRYYYHALAASLFLVNTAYYSELRGKLTAQAYSRMQQNAKPEEILSKEGRSAAAIHSADTNLEARFAGHRFLPLLTVGDDLLLLKVAESKTAEIGSKGGASVVVVKKALVSAMDFGALTMSPPPPNTPQLPACAQPSH